MKESSLAILLLHFVASSAFAQTPANRQPDTLLGFLKAGVQIGVESGDGHASVNLYVFSHDDYEIAKVVSKLHPFSIGELGPSAKRTLEPHLHKIEAYTKHMKSSQVDRSHHAALMRTSFGKIAAVRSDYVLVELEDPVQRREVISRSVIAKIILDAVPIQFLEAETTAPHTLEKQQKNTP